MGPFAIPAYRFRHRQDARNIVEVATDGCELDFPWDAEIHAIAL
jgi:hypothetical protein